MVRGRRPIKVVYREPRKFFDLRQETKNGIWVLIFLSLAVLSVLAFLDRAGYGGQWFNAASRYLFGWGFFMIPLAFLLLGASFLKSFSRKIYSSAIAGTLLLILGVLGTFFIIGEGDVNQRIVQGGYLGIVFGYPLLKLTGFTASLVVLLTILFVSIMVALDIPFHKLIFRGKEEEDKKSASWRTKEEPIVIKQGPNILEETAKALFTTSKITPRPEKSKIEIAKTEESEFVVKTALNKQWKLPPLDLLHSDSDTPRAGDIAANASIIRRTLANFGLEVEMGEVSVGPTVTQYSLRPAVGVKLNKITALHNDLALALASHPLRIEAPIPGKSLVGIEVPNKKSALVGLRNLLEIEEYQKNLNFLPIALGRDVAGYPVISSLDRMPHLLIAGATGTGKSIAINALILSLLYRHSPDILKFIMIDPKRVELTLYNEIPHLITPVIIDPKKTVNAMKWAVKEMERRYELLSVTGSRDIFSYNVKQSGHPRPSAEVDSLPRVEPTNKTLMPFIIIIIDELADLMASFGRDIEGAIVRLAQMARAVGIHLVVSTQRPSVEVITGLIKANMTTRVAFQVASQVDSRTILDMAGAEKLLGSGDMLYQAGDSAKPRRLQGPFVSEKEAKAVVKFLRDQEYEMPVSEEKVEAEKKMEEITQEITAPQEEIGTGHETDDPLYEGAKQLVIQAGKASASLLQRRLKIGYARAARLIDYLEERQVVGPADGARPREILLTQQPTTNFQPSTEPEIKSEIRNPTAPDIAFGSIKGGRESETPNQSSQSSDGTGQANSNI